MCDEATRPDDIAMGFMGASGAFYGLTKREYFAALSMAALVTTSAHPKCPNNEAKAKMAVNHADELIKALNEKG